MGISTACLLDNKYEMQPREVASVIAGEMIGYVDSTLPTTTYQWFIRLSHMQDKH